MSVPHLFCGAVTIKPVRALPSVTVFLHDRGVQPVTQDHVKTACGCCSMAV